MKHTFKLSTSNMILAIIAVLIIVIIRLRINGFDSYSLGETMGSAFFVLLFPTLIALLAWLLSGKKEFGGSIAFNIVIVITSISALMSLSKINEERDKALDKMSNAKLEYKKKAIESPDSIDANYKNLSKDIKNSIDELIKNSSGSDKNVYLVLKKFFHDSDSVNVSWRNSFTALNSSNILDYGVLNNKEEFAYQKQIVQTYINCSKGYQSFFKKRIGYFKNTKLPINKNSDLYKGVLHGVITKDALQRPLFMPYIEANISYGYKIKSILELLEREQGKWTFTEDFPKFKNPKRQSLFDEYLNDLLTYETTINELNLKLIDVM